ncbi:MAG: tetratricopeptide repeat-containing sensor histidine kinase [Mucilaginibacter sp.]
MLRSLLIFILLISGLKGFCLIPPGYAGNPPASNKIDSLKSLLFKEVTNYGSYADTTSINRINKLAAEFIEINPDSTLYYGNKGVTLARKMNYKAGIANGLLQTGHAKYFKGRFEEAKIDLNEAFTIFSALNSQKGLSDSYSAYGQLYRMQANYKVALGYLKMALGLYEQLRDNAAIADCYKNIGMVYFGEGHHSEALDYYYRALFLDVKGHDKFAAADIYNNIGDVLQNMELSSKALECYKKALKIAQEGGDLLEIGTSEENIGEVLLAQKHYDASIDHLSRAIAIANKQDDKDGISYISADLGLCCANKHQFTPAIYYLNTALQTASIYKIAYDKAYALIGFATVYNLQKDYQKAYKSALLGQQLAVKLNNLWFRANAVFELHKALAGLGKYEEAYKMSRQYIDLRASLNNDESIQKITSYNLEYDFAAKQHKLAKQQQVKDELYQQKLKQQKVNSIFLSIILSGMIVIALIYYRGKRKQQKINIVLEDKNVEVLQQKTDLDEQANKLNDLNHLKDRLISVLAHDLRAPLSTLRGLFSLLEDRDVTNEQFLDMIPHALRKLELTSDFLDTLLFWINSQMDDFNDSSKSFCIKEVVSIEINNYQEQAAEKGIKLIDNVEDDITVFADPNSIRIVIRNLITNAIKFSNKHDTIKITASRHDVDHILLSLKDTGTGMPEKQLNKLFKSKVESHTGTNNESGTGIGLLFCKDLIEKCHGTIWVQSEPGHGTEFFFTLPIGHFKEDKERALSHQTA